MKRPYFPPCVSRPRYALGYSIASTSPKTVTFRICEGGQVLRKDWGLPNGR